MKNFCKKKKKNKIFTRIQTTKIYKTIWIKLLQIYVQFIWLTKMLLSGKQLKHLLTKVIDFGKFFKKKVI